MAGGTVAVVGFILMPVFAQAHESSTTESFRKGGLGEVAKAVLQYVADFDETFPKGCGATFYQPIDGGWVSSIAPYLPHQEVLLAPRDPKSRATWPDWLRGQPDVKNISYASNGYMKFKNSTWGVYGLMGVDQSGPGVGWMSRSRATQAEVVHPNDTVMLAECYGINAVYGPSDVLTGVNWWDSLGTGGLIPDGSKEKEKTVTPYIVNGVVFSKDIRNGGLNAARTIHSKEQIAFADGHVKAMRPIETNPDPVTRPNENKWDIEHGAR